MKAYLTHYLLITLFAVLALNSMATHIRGGQIYFKHAGGTTVELTVIGFRDVDGVLFGSGLFDFGDGEFFGDEPGELIPWEVEGNIGNGLEQWTFTLVHTYPSGSNYTVSYIEDFRTTTVNNYTSSANTSFYVEALVSTDPIFTNSSPIGQLKPNFVGAVGEKFASNLMMTDEDGDSLSYGLVVPLGARGIQVDGYTKPSGLEINRLSGNLKWDGPQEEGLYAVAIRTEEWRSVGSDYFMVGYTILDYLIEIVEVGSTHKLEVPETMCQAKEDGFSGEIRIENEAGHKLRVTLFSELESLKFDGLTNSTWNQTNGQQVFTDSLITIDLEVIPDDPDVSSGFIRSYVLVEEDHPVGVDILHVTSSQAFLIGVDCDSTIFLVMGVESTRSWLSVTTSETELHITSQKRGKSQLRIFDLKGKLLLRKPLDLRKGDNLVFYQFETNTPYLIIIESEFDTFAQKMLILER